MIFNVHAGHNFIVPGAGGCFSETTEDRKVKDLVITGLRNQGHTVYDCTDESGATEGANLANIVAKCNARIVDLDVSIHFNAFNGAAHGVEVLIYNNGVESTAQRICDRISELGYTNRGVKVEPQLYVLRRTNSPALLVECCFCDNAGDASIYNHESMANAIVSGMLGQSVGEEPKAPEVNTVDIPIGVGVNGLIVTADTLNVRNAPGGSVIGTLRQGNCLGCDRRRWVNGECWFHYADGWVSGRYLTGWIAENGKWWHVNHGYTFKTNAWQMIDNTWYYFDKDGWMYTGWLHHTDGKWYYLTESGAMAQGAYVKSADGKRYYWISGGRPITGDTQPTGVWEEKWTTTTPDLSKWPLVK